LTGRWWDRAEARLRQWLRRLVAGRPNVWIRYLSLGWRGTATVRHTEPGMLMETTWEVTRPGSGWTELVVEVVRVLNDRTLRGSQEELAAVLKDRLTEVVGGSASPAGRVTFAEFLSRERGADGARSGGLRAMIEIGWDAPAERLTVVVSTERAYASVVCRETVRRSVTLPSAAWAVPAVRERLVGALVASASDRVEITEMDIYRQGRLGWKPMQVQARQGRGWVTVYLRRRLVVGHTDPRSRPR
jgi:hypothetical protein